MPRQKDREEACRLEGGATKWDQSFAVSIGLGSADIEPGFIEQNALDGAEYLVAALLGMTRAGNDGVGEEGNLGSVAEMLGVGGDAVRGRKMTVRPAFKAFGFNALTRRKADVKFGRLRAKDN